VDGPNPRVVEGGSGGWGRVSLAALALTIVALVALARSTAAGALSLRCPCRDRVLVLDPGCHCQGGETVQGEEELGCCWSRMPMGESWACRGQV
jgi:hypothetical protein